MVYHWFVEITELGMITHRFYGSITSRNGISTGDECSAITKLILNDEHITKALKKDGGTPAVINLSKL